MSETLSALVDAGERDRVALREPAGGGSALSARSLADEVTRLAGELSAAGVRRGDRVALVLPNGPVR